MRRTLAILITAVGLAVLIVACGNEPDELDAGDESARPTTTHASPTSNSRDMLVVQGEVDLKTGTGSIDSVVVIPDALMEQPEPGPFEIQVDDGNGQVLAAVSFDVSDLTGSGGGAGQAVYTVALNAPGPGARGLTLTRGEQTIASRTASDHPPIIEAVDLKAGGTLRGDEATIRWTATDQDGDELTYLVLFRAESTGPWTVLGADLEEPEASVVLDDLGRGSTGSITIVASDGFHSSRTQIDNIHIE